MSLLIQPSAVSRHFVAGLALFALSLALPAGPALAQEPSGVKGELLYWIEDAEKKLVELAEATPAAKYNYRPGKDARTTGEVFMHVVTANYGLPSMAGAKPPEGFNFQTHEKSLTKKADIEKALKDSFAHAKKHLGEASDADLDKPIDMFGRKTTVRNAYMLVLAHAHEHLGQSIAHARANNIAPPWTARNKARFEAARKEAAAKKP
jgi:uncharacterized damage-inducible protein DinB